MNSQVGTKSPDTYRLDFSAMGTEFFCILVGTEEQTPEILVDYAAHLESIWSRFISDSEVMKLNNNPDSTMSVSKETLLLIKEMKKAFFLTDGLYSGNVLGDLIDLGFGVSRKDPSKSTLWSSRVATNSTLADVQIDEVNGTALVPSGVALDPGGIGKGLAAELIASKALALDTMGIAVFAGGDVSVKGMSQDANGWEVKISHPLNVNEFISSISLSRGGLATSSILAWQGKSSSEHHIIDPRTHKSAESDVLQATVVTQSAAEAEALTKMCLILSAEEAIARVHALGASALLVTKDLNILTSKNWSTFE